MDYEKAYKDALNRAKHALDCHNQGMVSTDVSLITSMFPELAESEDEKIRKVLIDYFKTYKKQEECGINTFFGIPTDDIISWLEKQGEKDKPTYNTYSKDVQLTQEEYDKKRVSDEATIKEVEAYKKGLEDAQKIFEKQGEQKTVDEVEQECEESKTKIYDALTSFEDRLFAFVAGCEILTLPAKIEFIKEHSQELLDAAKEQIEKKHEEDMELIKGLLEELNKKTFKPPFDIKTFPESKPSDPYKPFDPWGHVSVYACPTVPYDPNIIISTTDTLNEDDKL